MTRRDARDEIAERGEDVLARMRARNRDKAMGTELALPDQTLEGRRTIELGGERIELLHLGPAHSPGDIVVHLPAHGLVIAGDIAFHQRLLPVLEGTDTAAWIDTRDAFAALEAGGFPIDAYGINQSAYRHLDTFDELAGLNADRICRAMEFEEFE